MAYLSGTSQEEDPNQQPGQAYAQGGQQPLMPGASGGGGTSGGPAGPSTPAPSPSSSSGGGGSGQYINFQSYMNANKGAAGKTAGAVASDLGQQSQQAQGDITGITNSFNQQVGAGSPFGLPPGSTSSTQPPGISVGGAGGTSSGYGGTPSAVGSGGYLGGYGASAAQPGGPGSAPDPSTLTSAQATQYGNQTYQGPKSFGDVQGYQNALNQVQQADANLAATGTDEGIQGLLQQKYGAGPGGYSQGQSAFDAGLTGVAGGGAFQALRQKYPGLAAQLDAANTAAGKEASAADAYAKQEAAQYAAAAPGLAAKEAQQAAANAGPTDWSKTDWGGIFGSAGNQEAIKSKPPGWSDDEWNAYNTADAWYYANRPGSQWNQWFNPGARHLAQADFEKWWASQQKGGG